jgi:inorganic pyrophosphatase
LWAFSALSKTASVVSKRERNDRLIGVPVNAPQSEWIQDIADLPQRIKQELEAFFAATAADMLRKAALKNS